jgi:hypothetical protein
VYFCVDQKLVTTGNKPRKVKKGMEIPGDLKNLPASPFQPLRGYSKSVMRSFFVEVERTFVFPAAAAELSTALGDFVEVGLALLIFCARGVGRMLGVGVIEVWSHDSAFLSVSQTAPVGRFVGFFRLAFSIASSVPATPSLSKIPVVSGFGAEQHFYKCCTRTKVAPVCNQFLHSTRKKSPLPVIAPAFIDSPFPGRRSLKAACAPRFANGV